MHSRSGPSRMKRRFWTEYSDDKWGPVRNPVILVQVVELSPGEDVWLEALQERRFRTAAGAEA